MKRLLLVDINGTITQRLDGKNFTPQENPEAIELIPGVAEGLQHYHDAGYTIVGVSNQMGILKGHRTHPSVATEFRCTMRLAPSIKYILYCPNQGSECWMVDFQQCRKLAEGQGKRFRKPGSGMLEMAISMEGCKPSNALMIGDQARDFEASDRIGAMFLHADLFHLEKYIELEEVNVAG